uniref:T. congolense-specific, cell surface-expressed gene family n=1 Tax=Trypanosoma congolense (strain IL3000) TaxID=1068625 RepID=G0UQS6_TRYCI|nr:hypothetical protein, unlikely [Trypanosoma congolense IL3000]
MLIPVLHLCCLFLPGSMTQPVCQGPATFAFTVRVRTVSGGQYSHHMPHRACGIQGAGTLIWCEKYARGSLVFDLVIIVLFTRGLCGAPFCPPLANISGFKTT